jgi:hypothetical protein
LKEWLDFKYRKKKKSEVDYELKRSEDNLVFGRQQRSTNPQIPYAKIRGEFVKILDIINMNQRKDGMLRRLITLHSFRRHCKTVISTQAGQDYSEWFLGHSKSPYWTLKEEQRRETYSMMCMPFLTFLDYGALENTSKGIISKLEQKNKEIAFLRERDLKRELEMKEMNERIARLDAVVNNIDRLEKKLGIS